MIFALEFTLAGFAAIIAAVGGFISAIVAYHKAKQEGDDICHDQLKECRVEAERYAKELHKIRISHPDLMPPTDEGKARLWIVISLGLVALATALAMIATGVSFGPDGPPGPPGPFGPQGPAGPQGTTATTVIVVPGTGTNTNTGTGGSNGTGATGESGSAGSAGAAGEAGTSGSPGAAGEAGQVGSTGSQGSTGPPGPPGPAGSVGPTGSPGPQGERGAPGPVQTAPICPQGFALTTIELKEKGNTILAAICVAQ
ncbi:MAG: hypothetical protein ABWY25_09535 [Paenisporosarcina sp.]